MQRNSDVAVERSPGANGPVGIARWGTLAGAAALMTYGLRRRSIPGLVLAAAAAPLAYRGLAGRWPRAKTSGSGQLGIKVREAIRLEKPLAEVYQFWRTLENLPRFMAHLERVTDLGGGKSHWVARGPGGALVEWDAEIINDVENQVIAWRSLPGADVDSAGSVNFDTMHGGQNTQVTVTLQYAPPAGRVGGWAAALVGREPSQMIREDLRRLKQLLETREWTTG